MTNEMTDESIMKLINRMHVKTRHTQYMTYDLSVRQYREYISEFINMARKWFGVSEFSSERLWLMWENLGMADFDWKIARYEIYTAIAS